MRRSTGEKFRKAGTMATPEHHHHSPRYVLESPGGFLNPSMSSTSWVLGKCRLQSSPRWLECSARTKKHVGQSPTGDAWPGMGPVRENKAGMKIRPGNWTLSCRP